MGDAPSPSTEAEALAARDAALARFRAAGAQSQQAYERLSQCLEAINARSREAPGRRRRSAAWHRAALHAASAAHERACAEELAAIEELTAAFVALRRFKPAGGGADVSGPGATPGEDVSPATGGGAPVT